MNIAKFALVSFSIAALGASAAWTTIATHPAQVTPAAPVQNETLANRVIAARQQDAALLKQFTWNSRVEILQNGASQDIRIEQVTLGADGKPQRMLLNDTPGALPNGFFRKAGAENKRKELEQYLADLRGLSEQYTLPSAGKVLDFLARAQVQPITSPEGKTLLQATGSGVVEPGDTFTLTLDGATFKTVRVQISTMYKGSPVTMSSTFATLKCGLSFSQFCTVDLPSKQATVMIHNYDFVQND